ncbi:MAG: hypothetical protein ACM3O3_05130 [Syntrophothermus sp.]
MDKTKIAEELEYLLSMDKALKSQAVYDRIRELTARLKVVAK